MVPVGINIHCADRTISWDGIVVPWKPKAIFSSNNLFVSHLSQISESFFTSVEDGFSSTHPRVSDILESKYDSHQTKDAAMQQVHLSVFQREQLFGVISKYTALLSGKLRAYPHQKVHLERTADCRPFSYRPYPVAEAHKKVFKQELDCLTEIGVLSPCGPSKLLSPSFIIPKKDGRVH